MQDNTQTQQQAETVSGDHLPAIAFEQKVQEQNGSRKGSAGDEHCRLSQARDDEGQDHEKGAEEQQGLDGSHALCFRVVATTSAALKGEREYVRLSSYLIFAFRTAPGWTGK